LIGIPLFSVVVHVLLESLLIFDVKNNMLSASASFEKNVKLFKIDCFVLGVGIVQQKSCVVYDVLRVQNFMQFNVIPLVWYVAVMNYLLLFGLLIS
jgi:hypothetical protein